MQTINELFITEDLLTEKEVLSDYNFMHVEELLKYSRNAIIPENTVVFGSLNRVHLVKNKMKSNDSFRENVTCVDINNFVSWITKAYEEKTRSSLSNEISLEQDDVLASENVQDEPTLDEPQHKVSIQELNYEDDVYETYESDSNTKDKEDIEDSSLHDEPKSDQSGTLDAPIIQMFQQDIRQKFCYEYLVDKTPLSSIASGVSINDHNAKELANAFITKLRSS